MVKGWVNTKYNDFPTSDTIISNLFAAADCRAKFSQEGDWPSVPVARTTAPVTSRDKLGFMGNLHSENRIRSTPPSHLDSRPGYRRGREMREGLSGPHHASTSCSLTSGIEKGMRHLIDWELTYDEMSKRSSIQIWQKFYLQDQFFPR